MDGRLWICGIAVAIAMFGLAWDFLYPFPLSRPVLIICSGSYFLYPFPLSRPVRIICSGSYFLYPFPLSRPV